MKLLFNNTSTYPFNEYLLLLIKDLCLYRLHKSHIQKKKYNNYIVIHYTRDLIDKMNISKIIHSNLSQQSFPADYSILDNTGISYKYSPTIRSKLTNYKQVANHIDYNAKCYCAEYEQFIDINYGHVLTGKLNIIKNTLEIS